MTGRSEVADLVVDPWIDHQPLRLYDEERLARRMEQEGASIVICEAVTPVTRNLA